MMNFQELSHENDEETLVRRAGEGDLGAFNQLVLTYQDMAYHHARTLLSDHSSAEDAAQDGFIKAFQSMKAFRGGSFRGWLLKIITNTAYDRIRRSHRYPTQPLFPMDGNGEEIESPVWVADPNTSVQGTVEQQEEIRRLYQILDELPDVYRSVLTLVDLYEMDYTDAAEALKVPLGTLKSRLARARLLMQQRLNCHM
jgi:RNA polymerase sigma-70 factor (ECF subfamily)